MTQRNDGNQAPPVLDDPNPGVRPTAGFRLTSSTVTYPKRARTQRHERISRIT